MGWLQAARDFCGPTQPVRDPVSTPKIPPEMFCVGPLSAFFFPGDEVHKLCFRDPTWGVLGGGQKVDVEKVNALFMKNPININSTVQKPDV